MSESIYRPDELELMKRKSLMMAGLEEEPDEPRKPTGDSPFLDKVPGYEAFAEPPDEEEVERKKKVVKEDRDSEAVAEEAYNEILAKMSAESKQEIQSTFMSVRQEGDGLAKEAEALRVKAEGDFNNLSDVDRMRLVYIQGRLTQLDDKLKQDLPREYKRSEETVKSKGEQIYANLKRACQEYPEYAYQIIENARHLPPSVLSSSSTYDFIAKLRAGEEALERKKAEQRRRASSMNSGAGRSGGGKSNRSASLTTAEIDVFRRMGISDEGIKRIAARRARGQE